MKYCAVCCIAKDEDFYIEEWVEYHLLLGFDTIIIYDNQSKTDLCDILVKYIADGLVIVHKTKENSVGEKAQGEAYTHCMTKYKQLFMWIAVIDVDEFIVLKKSINIKTFLSEYENYGGILLNWVLYGNPKKIIRTTKSQINNFTWITDAVSTTGKSIVRPARVEDFKGPHGPAYSSPYYAVNTDHFPLEPSVYSAPFRNDVAQINHYWLRTKQDFSEKVKKWSLSGRKIDDTFEALAIQYTISDTFAVELLDKLRRKRKFHLPSKFPSINALTEFFIDAVEKPDIEQHLDSMLCDCMCRYPDEPLIWLFRAVLARKRGNNNLALHFIKQASKLSGSSTIYNELHFIYKALGDKERSQRALEQARYKKHVEDTTCA